MAKKRANGDARPYEIKSRGIWAVSVELPPTFDEKTNNYQRKRKVIYGKTKTEVMQKKKQFEIGVYTGDYVEKSNITIYQLAKQLLDNDFNMNIIQNQTYLRHLQTLKELSPIYNTPLQKANETQINAFLLKEINKSQSVLKKEFALLKRTFNEAVKREIISKSPMTDARIPKSSKKTKKVRALTVDEQNKLMTVLMTKDINFGHQMLLSMLTGMRMGEINALKKSDINYNFNFISINSTISRGDKGRAFINDETKTEAGMRTIPLTADVKKIIDEVMKYSTGDMLFTMNNDGKTLINTTTVNMQFQRTLKKYDILDESVKGNVSSHSLRHTYATRCIEAGMNAKILQKLLGHTDIRVTLNTYADAFDDFQNNDIDKVNQYMKSVGLSLSSAEAIVKEA